MSSLIMIVQLDHILLHATQLPSKIRYCDNYTGLFRRWRSDHCVWPQRARLLYSHGALFCKAWCCVPHSDPRCRYRDFCRAVQTTFANDFSAQRQLRPGWQVASAGCQRCQSQDSLGTLPVASCLNICHHVPSCTSTARVVE